METQAGRQDQRSNAGSGEPAGGGSFSPAADWLAWPPHPAVWVAGLLAILLAISLTLLYRSRGEHRTVVLAPPTAPAAGASPSPNGPIAPSFPTVTPPPSNAPAETRREDQPEVSVRELPAPPRPPANTPANRPANGPWESPSPSAGPPLSFPDFPGAEPAMPDAPAVEDPAPPPAEERRATPERRPRAVVPGSAPERPAARNAGRLAIYFDADSSTFGKDDRRLPLGVEVYVDGVKRLESNDPEKREFDLGRLPEGPHEVRIVPSVGDALSLPREEIITVEGGRTVRYRAVLRRSRGTARVGKFKPQD